eukprot:TRINITY_DN1834_c0_g1_i7.p1 TRINITY_DN1834_c0_g1~~TRINITY_DN1834_c0_g1_i7.p1  ORF type:complete len:350 (+),score=111.56 TRINITY_DN1834_c0_g1_i7:669-1718(+)
MRVCGRDKHYRPVLYVLPKLAVTYITQEGLCSDMCKVIMEHILHYMIVAGKSENMVVVIDLQGLGLTSLPYNTLKEMISSLQANYNSRLAKMYILNVSFGIRLVWSIVSNFINPITRSKILVFDSGSPEELRKDILPCQLLKKYGGEFESPEHAWPPTFPPQMYPESPETHFTVEEFKKEVVRNKEAVPSPQVAEMLKGKVVGSRVPEKVYYLQGGINETRDQFNRITKSTKANIEETEVKSKTRETTSKNEYKEEAEDDALVVERSRPEMLQASTEDMVIEKSNKREKKNGVKSQRIANTSMPDISQKEFISRNIEEIHDEENLFPIEEAANNGKIVEDDRSCECQII